MGVRHDDPAVGIDWPLPVTVTSDKDRRWPLLRKNRPHPVATPNHPVP
jgi:dTDP-4-dehydrorhamnose 3,5-epimerase